MEETIIPNMGVLSKSQFEKYWWFKNHYKSESSIFERMSLLGLKDKMLISNNKKKQVWVSFVLGSSVAKKKSYFQVWKIMLFNDFLC